MKGEVVDLDGKTVVSPRPVSDFWFAQLEVRLGGIELVVNRLEKQVWLIVLAAFALLTVELLRAVTAQ